MIIEKIKNAIRAALFEADNNIIFHFEKMEHTDFPSANLKISDFKIEPNLAQNRQKCEVSLELCYMKSKDNKVSDLLNSVEIISRALLPVITIENRKITPDEVKFSLLENKLLMTFKLNFYTYENDENELMQTLDITVKEDKNAR